MKKLLGLLIAFVCFCGMSFAANQMGIVNYQKVFSTSKAIKGTARKLKRQFASQRNQVIVKQKALQKALANYQKNFNGLSNKKKQSVQDNLATLRESFVKSNQRYQKALMAAQTKEIKKVMARVNQIISQIAARKHLTIVFSHAAIAYIYNGVDITSDVIRAMK